MQSWEGVERRVGVARAAMGRVKQMMLSYTGNERQIPVMPRYYSEQTIIDYIVANQVRNAQLTMCIHHGVGWRFFPHAAVNRGVNVMQVIRDSRSP